MSEVLIIEFDCDLPCYHWGKEDFDSCPHKSLSNEGEEVMCYKCGWNLYINQEQRAVDESDVSGIIEYNHAEPT